MVTCDRAKGTKGAKGAAGTPSQHQSHRREQVTRHGHSQKYTVQMVLGPLTTFLRYVASVGYGDGSEECILSVSDKVQNTR